VNELSRMNRARNRAHCHPAQLVPYRLPIATIRPVYAILSWPADFFAAPRTAQRSSPVGRRSRSVRRCRACSETAFSNLAHRHPTPLTHSSSPPRTEADARARVRYGTTARPRTRALVFLTFFFFLPPLETRSVCRSTAPAFRGFRRRESSGRVSVTESSARKSFRVRVLGAACRVSSCHRPLSSNNFFFSFGCRRPVTGMSRVSTTIAQVTRIQPRRSRSPHVSLASVRVDWRRRSSRANVCIETSVVCRGRPWSPTAGPDVARRAASLAVR
jgi:hypothetical protein